MSAQTRKEIVLRLFIEHHRRVNAFARSMVDPATADDVTQETFFRLLKLPDLETRELSSSYLIKVAHNLIKRRKRRAQSMDRLIERQARRTRPLEERADAPAPGRQTHLHELPSHQHEAVRMIVCEGMSYRAAACALGVNVTTVNNWKHRGLARLREQALGEAPPGRSAAG